jgi:glutathione S-transferase
VRVYHREHTGRPLRVVWTLEELGQPYELEVMGYDQGQSEEHLARHPLGRVPVLEDDEGFVFESAAICIHLADLYPEAGLMPPLGTHDRALAYQWAIFAPAELEPSVVEAAIYGQSQPERAAKARDRYAKAAAAVAQRLDGRAHLVGERFTVADVLISSALAFAWRAGFPEVLAPAARDYVERLHERPAYRTALARTTELPATS